MLPPQGRWAPSRGPVWRGPGTAALPPSQRDPVASPLSSKKMYVALGRGRWRGHTQGPPRRAKSKQAWGWRDESRHFLRRRALPSSRAGIMWPEGGKVESDWTTGDSESVKSLHQADDGDKLWIISHPVEDSCVFRGFGIHD